MHELPFSSKVSRTVQLKDTEGERSINSEQEKEELLLHKGLKSVQIKE